MIMMKIFVTFTISISGSIDCLSKNSIFYNHVHMCHFYFFINAFYALHLIF